MSELKEESDLLPETNHLSGSVSDSTKASSSDKGETIVLAITTHGAVITRRLDSKSSDEDINRIIQDLKAIKSELTLTSKQISKEKILRLETLGIQVESTTTNLDAYNLIESMIADKVEPVNFKTPVKVIKYSAVAFGICNIVEDKIIKDNIEHLIDEFYNRKINWDKLSDEEIISNLESITQKYKDDHKSLVKGATEGDMVKFKNSQVPIDKQKLDFVYKADLGHTINIYEEGSELTEKAYSLPEETEVLKAGDAIYSYQIILFGSKKRTFDLYGQFLEINPNPYGVSLSDIIKNLSMIVEKLSRIVILDFTCNESQIPVSDREKVILRRRDGVKLGGRKNNIKKSRKSRKSTKNFRMGVKRNKNKYTRKNNKPKVKTK